jgi:hypothetical protein
MRAGLGAAMSIEIIAGFAGVIATVIISSVSLAYWLGKKFSEIDNRFKLIDVRFERLERRLDAFGECAKGLYLTLVDFMTLKKLFTDDERRYLLGEVERLSTFYEVTSRANPLKPEEIKFIKEVVREVKEKPVEELDLWKFEKIVEIAERLTKEEPSRHAFEFWMKAYMLYAVTRAEKLRREEEKRKLRSMSSQ